MVVLLLAICFSAQAQQSNKDVLGALRYRHIGPMGNRLTSVAGIPGQPNIYYVGAASGGIWKTIDGGGHWEPIFDSQPVSSIGALAIAPSIRQIRPAAGRVTSAARRGSKPGSAGIQ